MDCGFGISSRKCSLNWRSQGISPVFCFRSFSWLLYMVQHMDYIYICAYGYPFVLAQCVDNTMLSSLNWFESLIKISFSIFVGQFLDCLFCYFDLLFYLDTNSILSWLLYCIRRLEIRFLSSNFVLLQSCFHSLGPLYLHMNFRMRMTVSFENMYYYYYWDCTEYIGQSEEYTP
jgi:hypothetical protein